MEQKEDQPGGWRGSREGWLAAAREVFIETGFEAVKIQPLAQRLGLSRTSFYWFFENREALLQALLSDWEETNTGAILGASTAYAETLQETALNLIGVFLEDGAFSPGFERAVRGWAHGDAAVATRVQAADAARLAAITALFTRFGVPAHEADVRARNAYLVQIGYISMQMRESFEERLARIPDYVKIYTGAAPNAREMARFEAAHRPQATPR
ncbi:TetR family transcriptional regulator [Rhodobacter aestuarii]|uniref:Transcriptional regulator, TetR family n=1 Tax=Rhodobacter aestuarii TaxID=453582 RepID=A0A1N7NXD3_9RHOB|nr:TetR/AcrR family transcriptional regulator [Rhodobacter aestuarii]PTV94485.1 TetR family transcriptional regulator [Rhodobacter aestuarii]SIT02993.1 transcriptional regulator, TetR family [Rhodobacter aestuarii]